MKVLLLQDVKNIGRKNEIKEVSDGFALNALFPTNKAVPATASVVQAVADQQKEAALKDQATKDALFRKLKNSGGLTVTMKRQANDKGHLFAVIHKGEVIKAAEDELGTSVPVSCVTVPDTIKEVGEYDLVFKPHDKNILGKLIVERA